MLAVTIDKRLFIYAVTGCSCHSDWSKICVMSTATPASVPTVQDIPDKLHQPSANYKFPKRTFEKKKNSILCLPVCVAQPVANFCTTMKRTMAYCHTCLVTFKQRKMSKYNADPAFVRECQIAFNMLLSGIRGKQMSVASERSIFSENHCYKGLFVSRSTRTYLYFRV